MCRFCFVWGELTTGLIFNHCVAINIAIHKKLFSIGWDVTLKFNKTHTVLICWFTCGSKRDVHEEV